MSGANNVTAARQHAVAIRELPERHGRPNPDKHVEPNDPVYVLPASQAEIEVLRERMQDDGHGQAGVQRSTGMAGNSDAGSDRSPTPDELWANFKLTVIKH